MDEEVGPPKLLKTCPQCKWKGMTRLTSCYRKYEHPDGKARWLQIVEE